jgi:hypothetical protein
MKVIAFILKTVNRMAEPEPPKVKPDFEEVIDEEDSVYNRPNMNLSNNVSIKNVPIKNETVEEPEMEEPDNQEFRKSSNGSLRSETVTILPAPLSHRILSRLERQKNKYWHFKFVKESDFVNLEVKLLKDVGLTVQPNYGGKKRADVTLFKGDEMVGKIHFLHANRPDICDPTTFYVKLHFYDFEDDLFEPVKKVMIEYFHSLDQSKNTSFRGGKKTRKRKRNARRKTRRS